MPHISSMKRDSKGLYFLIKSAGNTWKIYKYYDNLIEHSFSFTKSKAQQTRKNLTKRGKIARVKTVRSKGKPLYVVYSTE